MSAPVIAILAALAPSEADPAFPTPREHYAVWLSALFHALEKQNDFDIHWVTLSKDITSPVRIKAKGQWVHILPRARRKIGLYTLYIHDRRAVSRELKLIHPDLVHAWGTEDCYALCGKDFEGNKLLSIQGILTSYMQRGPISGFHRKHCLYELPGIRAYQHITTESSWAADRIRELAPGRILHHLEYAVEESFTRVPRQLATQPCVLYAGSDIPLKNIGVLIKAFQDPRLSPITLKLAGVNPANHPKLPENIQALGRVSRETMVKLLSETWCLLHPSLADTGPTIVKEARVMGVPVILSTECGSKQYVTEGKSGFILNPHDVEGYIQATLRVCSSPDVSLQMGAHGQQACRDALSAKTMTSALLNLYRDLLATQHHD